MKQDWSVSSTWKWGPSQCLCMLGPWLPPFSSYGPGPYPGSLLAVLTLRPTRDLLIQSLRFNKNLCAWLRLRGASLRASLMAQQVKNPPALQETQEMKPQSLGREDCLEKEMETHSSILAWEIPWTEKSVGLQSVGLKRVWHDWMRAHTHTHRV